MYKLFKKLKKHKSVRKKNVNTFFKKEQFFSKTDRYKRTGKHYLYIINKSYVRIFFKIKTLML